MIASFSISWDTLPKNEVQVCPFGSPARMTHGPLLGKTGSPIVRILCLLAFCFLPLSVSADGFEETYDLPASIDLSAKRAEMSEAFPKIGEAEPRIRALIEFKRDHERFRIGVLEGLNEEIKKICEDLKVVERRINRDHKNGVISKNRFEDLSYQIEEERRNCLFENKLTSPYFKIYDDFKELYQDSSEDADVMIAECYASNACSGRG